MGEGEWSGGLGAHARLAAGVCGARAHAVPSDRSAAAPTSSETGTHQVADTCQAGSIIPSDAAGRAAPGRRAADPGARRGPKPGSPPRRTRQRTRDERSHRDSS